MATMNEIEQHTKEYADRRTLLSNVVMELNEAIEALKRKHLPTIKRRVAAAAETQAALHAALSDSRDLFVKPKTQVFHGIKVGFEKGKGKIEFENEDQVIKLIRKHLDADSAEFLIIQTEKPSKEGLAKLDAAMLKKLGVSVKDAVDQAVIRPTDSNVDKLVKALLDDAVEDAIEEGAP